MLLDQSNSDALLDSPSERFETVGVLVQVNSAETSTPQTAVRRPVPCASRSTFAAFRGSGASPPTTRTTFDAVAPFFSGDPADRAAWAEAIARTQAHDRRRAEIARGHRRASRSGAGARRARARRRAARRPQHGRGRHRPAGGALRRSAVHAAQGAHRAEAGRTGVARSRRARGRGLLDRRRRSRLGRSAVVYGVRRAS